jgi:hypothetical protein
MLAVIDETTPAVAGGICYCLASGLLLGDEDEARSMLQQVIPAGRKRPFHWFREGVMARTAMLAAIEQLCVIGRAVVVPCGRHRQEAARALCMSLMVKQLLDDGCDELVIEGRKPAQDGHDRAVMLDQLSNHKAPDTVTYRWDGKANELLWMAGAIAGSVMEHLTSRDEKGWYDRMVEASGLTIEYRALPH